MPAIMPVSELRSYTEVLSEVGEGSPVFLTRNGRGAYAVMDMRDYDRIMAGQAMVGELSRGRASGENEGWVSAQDARARFEARLADKENADGR